MSPEYAFDRIYNEYYPIILRYVTRIVGQNNAEDTAQEVFDKINRGLEGFQGKSKLSSWVYRIATNTAIDKTRSAIYKREREQVAIEDGTDNGSKGVMEGKKVLSTDQLVIQKEMGDCINEYIDTLPSDYKTVIVLSELEGLTNNEIAEILNISVNNVKVRLHRARAKLKEVLNDACEFYYTDQNTLSCDRKQVQILSNPPK